MGQYVFERTEPDAKNRCQGLSHGSNQQCPFKQVEGSKYCPRHGGNSAINSQTKLTQRLYILSRWKAEHERQADHPKIKSLREELGVMRMMLEIKLNSLENEQMLLMSSGQITEMVREIAKTAKICHALEISLNVVLDKAQAQAWVQELGEILSRYVQDPDLLQMASEDMLQSLEQRTQPIT